MRRSIEFLLLVLRFLAFHLRSFRLLALAAATLVLQVGSFSAACQPAPAELLASTAAEFRALDRSQAPVDPNEVDYQLLAEAVFHESNRRRDEHGVPLLDHLQELGSASCLHAEDMVADDYFAHRNPDEPEQATPLDRLRAQGLRVGFVAENIGEAFAIDYESGERVFVRKRAGETVLSREPEGEPIAARNYVQVAESLVDSWMASEGHRKNLLAREPRYLGAGCQASRDERLDVPMFVCVQLFFTPLAER